jgi:hypothetical protein
MSNKITVRESVSGRWQRLPAQLGEGQTFQANLHHSGAEIIQFPNGSVCVAGYTERGELFETEFATDEEAAREIDPEDVVSWLKRHENFLITCEDTLQIIGDCRFSRDAGNDPTWVDAIVSGDEEVELGSLHLAITSASPFSVSMELKDHASQTMHLLPDNPASAAKLITKVLAGDK